jgi:hypothetical protein
MIKIRFFSSFCDSENVSDVYVRISELNNSDKFGKKYIFVNDNTYTHAIIINTAMPKLNIPKENVIGLAFEPLRFLNLTSIFIEYARKHIGQYFIGSHYEILGKPFIGNYSYMWHITPLTYIPIKNKLMSLMISNKLITNGHKYRHTLCKKILEHNLPIDIWGRGCKFYKNKANQIKGEFNNIEPYENYTFHIAVENFRTNYYFSKKITNPLLCNTIPVYLGCTNIEKYFPNNVIILTGNCEKDINIIKHILSNPDQYLKKIHRDNLNKTLSIENVINDFNTNLK